jgi:hypothetical protein
MDKRLLVLACGMFAIGTDSFVVAGVLRQVSVSLGVSIALAGRMVTLFALSYALLSPVIAAAAAHWPRKRLLLTGLAVRSRQCHYCRGAEHRVGIGEPAGGGLGRSHVQPDCDCHRCIPGVTRAPWPCTRHRRRRTVQRDGAGHSLLTMWSAPVEGDSLVTDEQGNSRVFSAVTGNGMVRPCSYPAGE